MATKTPASNRYLKKLISLEEKICLSIFFLVRVLEGQGHSCVTKNAVPPEGIEVDGSVTEVRFPHPIEDKQGLVLGVAVLMDAEGGSTVGLIMEVLDASAEFYLLQGNLDPNPVHLAQALAQLELMEGEG